MNKLELAHQWYMKHSESALFMDLEVEKAWEYADLMLAEDEKRKDKSLPEVLKDAFVIDWDAVSERYDYWVMDKDGRCFWYEREPRRDSTEFYQNCDICLAPDFGYKGDWRQSLRKRPE